jgi:hypothetical protein
MDTVVVSRLLLSKKEDEANAAQYLLADAAARASQAERDEAVAVLLDALEKDERRVQRRTRAALWVAVGVPCIFGVAALLLAVSRRAGNVVLFVLCFNWLGSMIGNLLRAKRCSRIRARVALALTEHGDVRAVGPLIEAYLAAGSEDERGAVTRALNALLPFVAPGHESLLNERQRDALDTSLGRWNPRTATTTTEEIEGYIVLVEVAACVGGKSAADALTSLLAKWATTDDEWRLIRAAQAALATLNERLEGTHPVAAGASRFRTRP